MYFNFIIFAFSLDDAKMKRYIILVLLVNLFIINVVSGQDDYVASPDTFLVGFYNVENLFHPSDDSLHADEDFTPTGLYHWSYKKYYRKISNVAKVLIAMGEANPPLLMGVAEIENDLVLRDLCYRSPLKKFGYKYIHHESPDRRGIDVALLYRKDYVQIDTERAVPVVFPFSPQSKNRDVLYVKALIDNTIPLHIFVNHWTSRYSGYAATIPKRNYYAQVVRNLVDSILYVDKTANIIIVGDFNDYATDPSLDEVLHACPIESRHPPDTLYNLMYGFETASGNVGSHKHEDFWGCLDQIIVSNDLLSNRCGLEIVGKEAHIFNASFLLVPDEKYGGYKTYRTFLGPRYIGGFADHLPVFVKLTRKR